MTMPLQAELVDALVREFADQKPIRTGSLVVTVYGDAVAPRGGSLWLGSLLALMGEFGIGEPLVRTAMSRLAADGWFDRSRIGRRSFYHLTESGRRRFAEATRRIYAGPPEAWPGTWTTVLLPGGAGPEREILRKGLGWLGFGQLAPGVLVHPTADRAGLSAVLGDLEQNGGGMEGAVVIEGAVAANTPPERLRRLAASAWPFETLAIAYSSFIERFSPLDNALGEGTLQLEPLQCMLVRLQLIHAYRRVILRDPMLPPPLLPERWVGRRAHALCRSIYAVVAGPAEQWIDEHFVSRDGPLPPPDAAFRARFGGLPT